MRTVYETREPRPEVLSEELAADLLAAKLGRWGGVRHHRHIRTRISFCRGRIGRRTSTPPQSLNTDVRGGVLLVFQGRQWI